MRNRGISVKNSNALITKVDPNELFGKLVAQTQHSKSQASLCGFEFNKSRPKTMFSTKRVTNNPSVSDFERGRQG